MADEKTNLLTKKLSPKVAIAIAAGVLLALGAAFWGPSLFRKLTDRPPSSAEVYSTIWSYLRKRTGEKDFALDMNSIANDTADASSAAGDQKKRRRQASQQNLHARYFRQKQDVAGTYKEVYKLIGQELKVAETLVANSDPAQKEAGLVLMADASRFANDPAGDPWLSARICEGYLWKHLDLAEGFSRSPVSAERLLSLCESAFREAGETNNVVRNYKLLIAKSQGTQVDITRFRLARVLEDQGEYKEALDYLKQMTNTNKNGWVQRVAALEQKVKNAGK